MKTYGVTEKGFVLKRLDTILEEVHADLTEGFGIDTRLSESSFLNVLVTSFCSQIADLWETAQDDYYSKYPTTATGVNLDNAVQFGGVRRKNSQQSMYPLHCSGDDGTVVRKGVVVATDTKPEVRLFSAAEFTITRKSCNALSVKVAAKQAKAVYTITINGSNYSFVSTDAIAENILTGLKTAITDDGYNIRIQNENLIIEDKDVSRENVVALTDNLTTSSVTTIANFYTEEYGKITLPNGLVSKFVNNIAGFTAVTNILEPVYGRNEETDVELRQSYIARSALRSTTMLGSIIAELLNNVSGVETASGYENDGDVVNERGMPPHSIELIVEGGDVVSIANAILNKKAGGIQTFGNIETALTTSYGDVVTIRFNRPEYLYTWIKVVLHGTSIPTNYGTLVKESIIRDTKDMVAGSNLFIQQLTKGIYDLISGVTYVDIYTASSTNPSYVPGTSDYVQTNVEATTRQKILIAESRIEVSLHGGS